MAFVLACLAGLAAAIPHASSASAPPASSSLATPTAPHCKHLPGGTLPSPTPIDFHFSGNVRTHYIAAEEIDWDYAPSGWDNWLSVPIHLSPRAQDADYTSTSLGTKWRKAVYRGYTDASFAEKTEEPAWQGLQGPTIRAEVGDMVEILFTNKMSTHYASMHSMGLSYSQANEGAVYEFANETHTADAVPPGGCVLYKWVVPESAAPSKGEPATTHAYHSYISIQEDLNAGLVGLQMTYQRGMMAETMRRYREFPVLLQGIDESASFLAAANAQRDGQKNATVDYESAFSELRQYGNETVWKPQMTSLLSSTKFDAAPEFYALNGYVFGNLPTFEMCLNDEVIWYVYGQGDDPHSFHMHGNGFTHQGQNMASIDVVPGTMATLYMNATGPGHWQLICHINEHVSKGMMTYYDIKNEECPRSWAGIIHNLQEPGSVANMGIRLTPSMTPDASNFAARDSSFFKKWTESPPPEQVREKAKAQWLSGTSLDKRRAFSNGGRHIRPPPAMFENMGLVVKWGVDVGIAEAQSVYAVHRFLDCRLPVPEVYGWRTDGYEKFIYMLVFAWPGSRGSLGFADHGERDAVFHQLRTICDSFRQLEQDPSDTFISNVIHAPFYDRVFPFGYPAEAGPFPSVYDTVLSDSTKPTNYTVHIPIGGTEDSGKMVHITANTTTLPAVHNCYCKFARFESQ